MGLLDWFLHSKISGVCRRTVLESFPEQAELLITVATCDRRQPNLSFAWNGLSR